MGLWFNRNAVENLKLRKELHMTTQRKFIEEVPVDGWSIKTDTGFRKISHSAKTIEYQVWDLKTTNHSLQCADNHIVFKDDYSECFVQDLNPGDFILTENGPEQVVSVEPMLDSEHMFDLSVESDDHRYYTDGILSHNTTIGAFYLLYEASFPRAKGDILIVAHKQGHAMEVLKRLKDMYFSCPMWLKPGLVKNNETSIEFDNGMRIIAEATTANAARGKTLRFVYCVDGETKITIRNKETGEIREIDIQDLYFNQEYK